jgi:DNA-binding beta-propeller fold protein YncE
VNKSGDIFVADAGNNRVEEFSNSGTYLGQFTHGLNYPEGLALDSSGDVFVADTYNNRVVEFSSADTYLSEIDGLGDSFEGAFPEGIAVDDSGNILVSEADGTRGLTDCVVVYNASHAYVTKFGSFGTQNGQFYYPYGLAVDPSGNVYVADSDARVEEFTVSGVPEPSALALLSVAALGVLGYAWRHTASRSSFRRNVRTFGNLSQRPDRMGSAAMA